MAKRKRGNAGKEEMETGGDEGGASDQNLYKILGVARTATQDEIRKAYHKLALRLHPDKNPDDKDANNKFQALQGVFAVLGDPEKRAIYDETGSVEESPFIGKDGKELYQFFKALYKTVAEQDIEEFAASYRGSDEEMADLKKHYTECKGNMNRVFQMVMCSDPDRDSHRFMEAINSWIASGEVKETKTYKKWAKEVEKRPAPSDPLAPPPKADKAAGSFDLVAAIQRSNITPIVTALEAKFSKPSRKGKKSVEPSEEEFEAARARLDRRKKR